MAAAAKDCQNRIYAHIKGFKQFMNELKIVAECTPQKKRLLAETLRKIEKITCFSGDSIGDCIAMAEANVSMCMNNCGTDVAKKTCDLVVSKDF